MGWKKNRFFGKINLVPRASSVLKITVGQTQPRSSTEEYDALRHQLIWNFLWRSDNCSVSGENLIELCKEFDPIQLKNLQLFNFHQGDCSF